MSRVIDSELQGQRWTQNLDSSTQHVTPWRHREEGTRQSAECSGCQGTKGQCLKHREEGQGQLQKPGFIFCFSFFLSVTSVLGSTDFSLCGSSSPSLIKSPGLLITISFLLLNVLKPEPWPRECSNKTNSPGHLFWVDWLASRLAAVETREVYEAGWKPSCHIHWLRIGLWPFPPKLSDARSASFQSLPFYFLVW